ncbi:MAG: phosphoribosylformylglycinamidine synthase, partial [Gammaproteobacteria bacterium]
GAATGAGGEIRDEGATGRGAAPKAGLTGFSVSHLHVPELEQPWEQTIGRPERIASACEIMLSGPIGGAAFNNEFGRPNILGYFRTYEQLHSGDDRLASGYHKPIMIAGGVGNIRRCDVEKPEVPAGSYLIVLGGPAMLIGLGGGAASSMGSGTSSEDLDFASVQRGNPEMERRAQQVIDSCWSRGVGDDGHNPIILIHDVGAGGLSNAVPEVVDHSKLGATVNLRDIPNAEPGMAPVEIWCNEAQERYVLAVAGDDLELFEEICERERCPFAVIGVTDTSGRLIVEDGDNSEPVNIAMDVLLGKPPQTVMRVERNALVSPDGMPDDVNLEEACSRVLQFPTVADKSFLIHIGDRTVGGLVSRDQLIGPWQVPVSDVAVTARDFTGYAGEAMAMGERTPVAVLDPAASGRLAVGEALTNLVAADIERIDDVVLSANWMAACGHDGESQALFDTVTAIATGFCQALGIAIPVGKDSLSMQTSWSDGDIDKKVYAPLSLIISAFAPVADIRNTLTPQLEVAEDAALYLIDLGQGKNRLGASCFAQVYSAQGGAPADVDDVGLLRRFVEAVIELRQAGLLRAYHDRSDGGIYATLCEMAFASRCGLDISLPACEDAAAALFSEELGAVVQIRDADRAAAQDIFSRHALGELVHRLGTVTTGASISIKAGAETLCANRVDLNLLWSTVTYRMQELRDNPESAGLAYLNIRDVDDPGLNASLSFDPAEDIAVPYMKTGIRPKVAILREQGVNSHAEMAAAFHRAGFNPVDVHMSDLLGGTSDLEAFKGLIACGGFSYGDVLGAGGGWAKSILFNSKARDQFETFFNRADSFALGVCNGCQMFADLADIIPGTAHWPRFVRNTSEQFEARLSLVEVGESASVLLSGMQGSRMPIVSSHGEGRAEFAGNGDLAACTDNAQVCIRYVDNYGKPTDRYPANPNGSPGGLAGVCSVDGRITAFMPHPERVARTVQHSWHPDEWSEDGPWLRMFRNARVWVG